MPDNSDQLTASWAMERINQTLAVVEANATTDEGDRSLLIRFMVEVLSRPAKTPELLAERARGFDDPASHVAQAEVNRALVERFAPLIEAAQQAGEIERGWDPEALVELVDILVEGINRRHFTTTFATGFQRVGDTALALLLGGILVPEKGQRRG